MCDLFRWNKPCGLDKESEYRCSFPVDTFIDFNPASDSHMSWQETTMPKLTVFASITMLRCKNREVLHLPASKHKSGLICRHISSLSRPLLFIDPVINCCASLLGLRFHHIRHLNSARQERERYLHTYVVAMMANGETTGYQDSGADIAFNLCKRDDVEVVTPAPSPEPAKHQGWSFPDTEDGILKAVDMGATHLWANTILFASHPLQVSDRIGGFKDHVRVVGQPPLSVEKYDDKDYVNSWLRSVGGFSMPRARSMSSDPTSSELSGISFPVVAKPARGRGSYGVKVCRDAESLLAHLHSLREQSLAVILEQFLEGEEATITVMPPATTGGEYWSLPIVSRFNHENGIAPYSGAVAVSANSFVPPNQEQDPAYAQVQRECEEVGRLLKATAPIRIDVRRYKDSSDSRFLLFDVNMKPVCSVSLFFGSG